MRNDNFSDGVSIKAYAGTTGVLLAFDVVPERRKGLLGFAIERDGGNRPHRWLQGMLHFPGQKHEPGQPIDSNVVPIQKFRWSDYSVYPDTDYTYTVYHAGRDPKKSLGFIEKPFDLNPYSFGVRKGDQEWLTFLNFYIYKLHQSGKMKELYKKWFNAEPARVSPNW